MFDGLDDFMHHALDRFNHRTHYLVSDKGGNSSDNRCMSNCAPS
jgi:hypothetical protein